MSILSLVRSILSLSLSLSILSFIFNSILSLSLSLSMLSFTISIIYLEAGSSLGFSPKFPQRNLSLSLSLSLNSVILFNTNVNIYKE